MAGYTPGEADLVRRAISKKKASEIERHKQIFIDGCAKNDIPKSAATAIYEDIEFFARYGFNKCLPGDVEVVDAETGRLVRIEDLYTGKAQLVADGHLRHRFATSAIRRRFRGDGQRRQAGLSPDDCAGTHD